MTTLTVTDSLKQLDGERAEHWRSYYDAVIASSGDGLDYPTTRMHSETLGMALRWGGELSGTTVLDAGSGRGQLAVLCETLGAKVTAFDYSDDMIAGCKKRWPGSKVTWAVGDLGDEGSWPPGFFDTVFCIEALHVVPTSDGLVRLWNRVAPGGRLMAMFTNADNPINDVATWRNGGVAYYGLGKAGLNPTLRRMAGVATWRVQGMTWADDQRIEVYESRKAYDFAQPPYSWVLCAVKAR